MDRLPAEVINLIVVHVQALNFDPFNNIWFSTNNNWRREVARLRLVHPLFASALKNVLFQQVDVTLCFNHYDALDRLDEFIALSQSHLASSVLRIEIELSSETVPLIPHLTEQDQVQFFTHLVRELPICLRNLPSLCSLHIGCSRGQPGSEPEELIPITQYEQVNNMLATILRHLSPKITDLTLRVPSTHTIDYLVKYDAARIFDKDWYPLREKLSRLTCLELEICDNSGPDGQRFHSKNKSQLLELYGPHERYARSFFQFVSLAINLEALSIQCTSALNLDSLNFKPLRDLRQICLYNVNIRAENLRRLLDQNSQRLEMLWLARVELYSGIWEGIFMRCCEFPCLFQLDILACGYSKSGESAAHSQMFAPEPWNPVSIEGYRQRDRHALGNLMRTVNARRREKGLLEVTDRDEPAVLLPPLAECGIPP